MRIGVYICHCGLNIAGVKEVVGHPEAEMASITNTENSASTEVNKNSGEKNASAS